MAGGGHYKRVRFPPPGKLKKRGFAAKTSAIETLRAMKTLYEQSSQLYLGELIGEPAGLGWTASIQTRAFPASGHWVEDEEARRGL
jgi:hypothetical protein